MASGELLAAARRVHYRDRDVARAWGAYEAALATYDRDGELVLAAEVATELANLRVEQGWWTEAVALVHDAKQRAARAGASELAVHLDVMSGEIALRSGDRDGAARISARAIELARLTGHALGRALMHGARVAQDEGELGSAARLLDEARVELERTGDDRRATLARFRRALVELEARGAGRSEVELRDALALLASTTTDAELDPLIRREAALYAAAVNAFAGREADARSALDEARAVPDAWTSSRHGRHVIAIYEAIVAAAFDPDGHDRARAAALAAEAPGADGSAAVNCFYVVRAGVRLVRMLVPDARPIANTRVAADGTWFQLVDGRTVELGHRPMLSRLLAALARSGHASVATLLAAAWPNQAAVGTSGELRVYTSIARLRKLGLRDHIVAIDGGYRLDGEIVRTQPESGRLER